MKILHGIKTTPKKQIQKKQALQKMLILIITFLFVFVISGCFGLIIYNKTGGGKFGISSFFGNKGSESNIFEIRPTYNVINENYNIGKQFSYKNPNGLTGLQVGCALFFTIVLVGCGFYIDNIIVFTLSMIITFALMFNGIDSVADGMALDYIKIKDKYIGIELFLLGPVSIPYYIQGKSFSGGIINFPDIILSVGIDLLIIYTLIKILDFFSEKIENKRYFKTYQKKIEVN